MAVYIFPGVIDPAPADLIDLARAKDHLKVDHSEEDELIKDYLQAAINEAENYTGRNFNLAKFTLKSPGFEDGLEFKLVGPVATIDSIKYLDTEGAENTLAVDQYELLPLGKYSQLLKYVDPDSLPDVKEGTTRAVMVEVTVGYTAATLPKAAYSAILLILGGLYENREDTVYQLPTRAKALLQKYRVY